MTFKRLKRIDLSNNLLTTLPREMKNLTELEEINVMNNPFESLKDVMDSLKKLPKLKILKIHLNDKSEFKKVIFCMKQLKYLNGYETSCDTNKIDLEKLGYIKEHKNNENQEKVEPHYTNNTIIEENETSIEMEDTSSCYENQTLINDIIKIFETIISGNNKFGNNYSEKCTCEFQAFVENISLQISKELKEESNAKKKNIMVLVYIIRILEECFTYLITYFKFNDSICPSVLSQIKNAYHKIVEKIICQNV